MVTTEEIIQGLQERIQASRAEIEERQRDIDALARSVSILERQLSQIPETKPLPDEPQRSNIPWSSILSNLFQGDERLTLGQVCERLVTVGILSEIDPSKRASISSTLTRKVTQGELAKDEDGSYHRPPQPLHGFNVGVQAEGDESQPPALVRRPQITIQSE
jgi:hypothetical protein